jgi:hypothetical protein
MLIISGHLAIIFYILKEYILEKYSKFILTTISTTFFLFYWPTCLHNGGLSLALNTEEDSRQMGISFAFAIFYRILVQNIGKSIIDYPFYWGIALIIICFIPIITIYFMSTIYIIELLCNLKRRKKFREDQQPYWEICRDLIFDFRVKNRHDNKNYEELETFSIKRLEIFLYGIFVIFISNSVFMLIGKYILK